MNPDRELISSLTATLTKAVGDVLGNERACALTIFPDQWNAGDSAIWMGTSRLLDSRGIAIRYTCGYRSYNAGDLRRQHPAGPILLCGGGNFGDVYQNENGLRQDILRDFPDRTIIQLPQSIWFRNPDQARAMAAMCRAHPRFHLMVRDKQSLHLAREQLGIKTDLIPDMAFGLSNLQQRRGAPVCDILWLRRRDSESLADNAILPAAPNLKIECRDWTVPDYRELQGWQGLSIKAYDLAATRLMTAHGNARNMWLRLAEFMRPRLANRRIDRGCSILSRGRVVIADRLHAHILCLLMGIPHVLMDNVYGKNSAMYETWTRTSHLTRWAASDDEALRHAGELLHMF